MQNLYFPLLLSMLWINTASLTLLSRRVFHNPHIARSAGVLILVSLFFLSEHFVGFGDISLFSLITLCISLFILYRHKSTIDWKSEGVFIGAMAYTLSWRIVFPDIDTASEKITNLYFISNYMTGATLPPLDNWYPPHLFDSYYAFQHYGAALFGRFFNLQIGIAYNIGAAFLAALTITLAWVVISRFIEKRSFQALLLATFVFGGTGLSPLLSIVYDKPSDKVEESIDSSSEHRFANYLFAFKSIIRSARFIGTDDHDELSEQIGVNQHFADLLFPKINKPDIEFEARVLPLENFGYQLFIGDFHPPVGGFFFLMLALALIVSMKNRSCDRKYQALLVATVPLVIATNAWVFPLQMLLVSGWLAYGYCSNSRLDLWWIIAGGLVGVAIIYPFLTGFATSVEGNAVSFVQTEDHTPLSRFCALLWPILVLMLLSLLGDTKRQLSVVMLLTFTAMLLLTELVYIDDPTSGIYLRTNTVMKWWGYIFTGSLIFFGALCLSSNKKYVTILAVVTLLPLNVNAVHTFKLFYYSDNQASWKLHGHHWLTKDVVNRDMFEYLDNAPFGIVLENLPNNAFMQSSVFAIFNKKASYLGWPSHLSTWHDGNIPRVWNITEEVRSFYNTEMDYSVQWLRNRDIQYIVFDYTTDPDNFDSINEQISSDYRWLEFNPSNQRKLGIWLRRDNTVQLTAH